MSGDVQPRKRKDKKRKREDEPREQHQGVHGSKMGNEDVHLHVQGDHETGGHWCAKLFFFSLLVILLGLIGLIILENRGLADLDTPLSESRFSNYFDGWVDEHREAHDEHDAVTASIEEHEHGDEPFEEEEDHSEVDETEEDDEEHDHDVESEGDGEHEEDEEETKENEEETEELDADTEEEAGDETQEDDEEENDDETLETQTEETREDDDDEDVDNKDDENEDEDEEPQNGNNEDEDEEEDTVEEIEPPKVRSHQSSQQSSYAQSKTKEEDNDDDDDDEPFEEEDDDGTFESLESVVDNDGEELLLLQEKARQQQASLKKDEPEPEEEPSSYASPQIKPRGGGPQSMDDDEFEEELKKANEEMLRENLNPALTLFDSLSRKFPDKPEVFIGKAKVLDKMAETLRSNSRLSQALDAYKRYLAFGEEILNDLEFVEVAQRCVDRMRFMGLNLQAVSIHEMLIERFPNEVSHRNQLAVTYLMVNRLSDAKQALEEILARWPDDGYAMVHYGFVLKSLNQNLNLAAEYLRRGIDSQQKGTQDGRFYFNLGDALQRLGRLEEAREIYRRGAALKLFPSEYQRSLYNVNSLRAQPFWSKTETNYEQFLNRIEENWQAIRDEGLSVLNAKGVFEDETENLRDTGDWKQLELFSRGQRRQKNCLKAPITCGIIETFPSARFCKRGQVKFSVMHPGTHVWPHCGPTNCRLRAHLGLKVPPGTVLRVAEEKRTWEEGKFLIFDDSCEHEVWHNGNNLRLVLIVDVWHPDLTEQQRQSLSPI